MAIKETTTYTASDGTLFEDKKQAQEYEKQLETANNECPLVINKIREDIESLRSQIAELRVQVVKLQIPQQPWAVINDDFKKRQPQTPIQPTPYFLGDNQAQ